MNSMRRLQAVQAQAAAAAARAAVAPPRQAIVDSWDPVNQLVRVRLQPEDILTGWMPWKAVAAGSGWGLMASPFEGTQVEVTFEGGDVQIGSAGGGVFSDVDRPPQGPAGQGMTTGAVWAYDQGGSSLRLPNTGKVAADGAMGVNGAVHSSAIVTSAGAPSTVITTSTGDVLHVQDGVVSVAAGASINPAWFAAALARMQAAESCAELQEHVTQAFGSISQLQGQMSAQLAALQPFLALVKPPTDLPSLLTWVENLITALVGPQAAAFTQLVSQEAALASRIASFTSSVQAIEHECSVTLPPLPGVAIPAH